LYVAIGVLSVNSYHPITPKQIEDFYQLIMTILITTLPFFVVGIFTDQDEMHFQRKPLQETFNVKNLFMNHPATGPFFLVVLLASISVTLMLCTSVPSKTMIGGFLILLLWIGPWLLLFLSLRLAGIQARGIFVSYILGILLVVLASTFYHSGKTANTVFDFFLITPVLIFLYVAALAAFIFTSIRASRRLRRIG
jgi:hypothetical protein